jgi:hypothetical protein
MPTVPDRPLAVVGEAAEPDDDPPQPARTTAASGTAAARVRRLRVLPRVMLTP